MFKFDINQKVPTHFAFIIILMLSFLLSWYVISKGNEIVKETKDSSTFNVEKRFKLEKK
jgi:hypothetical protein